jgi:hypothetical protein
MHKRSVQFKFIARKMCIPGPQNSLEVITFSVTRVQVVLQGSHGEFAVKRRVQKYPADRWAFGFTY